MTSNSQFTPGEHLIFPADAGALSESVCDGTSVGVLVVDEPGNLLMFERATFPVGLAPVAGHLDDHGDAFAAAEAEVGEELGLKIVDTPRLLAHGWRPNVCQRTPDATPVLHRPGHFWTVLVASVEGTLDPSPRETRNARWMSLDEVAEHARITAAWVAGDVADETFATAPGLEPVWMRWIVKYFERASRRELADPLVPQLAAIEQLWTAEARGTRAEQRLRQLQGGER